MVEDVQEIPVFKKLSELGKSRQMFFVISGGETEQVFHRIVVPVSKVHRCLQSCNANGILQRTGLRSGVGECNVFRQHNVWTVVPDTLNDVLYVAFPNSGLVHKGLSRLTDGILPRRR